MATKIFTRLSLIFIVLILLACCQKKAEQITQMTGLHFVSNPSRFEIRKGVNLSHWLSQTTEWSMKDKFITQADIELIKSFGFDHIRLPIDEQELWHEDGTVIVETLQYVKNCLNWCAESDLRTVIDLHILRSHHFNARNNEGKMTLWAETSAQNNFIKLWENLSEYLKDYPNNMVAYEIMNEPVAPDHEQWNELVARAVKALAQTAGRNLLPFPI